MTIDKRTALGFLFLSVVTTCSVACSALTQAHAMVQETTGSYPKPPKALEASPDATGVLLVDASIASYELDGVLLEHLASSHRQFRAASFEEPDLKELALFSGLEPGAYRVAGFRGRNSGGTYFVKTSNSPMYNVTIEVGKASYLGRFEAEFAGGTQITVVQMARAGRQTAAWSALLRKYPGSSWAPLIQSSRSGH